MALTTTERSTPTGTMLEDGFPILIAFASDPDAGFWEKGVKPPGIDGGDAIDISTQHNVTWRTFAARSLKTLTPITIRVAYDPAIYDNILALINVPQSITIHFPDDSTLNFFGYLRSFEPGDQVEGSVPEATVTIVPTNKDPSTGAETAPDFSDTGTAA